MLMILKRKIRDALVIDKCFFFFLVEAGDLSLSVVWVANQSAKMQNEEGQNMDLYIPRKWYTYSSVFLLCGCGYFLVKNHSPKIGDLVCHCSSATNRLITSKDHASVQINIGHLDANGLYTGQFTTFALCGFVRAQVLALAYLLFLKNQIFKFFWVWFCSCFVLLGVVIMKCNSICC